MTLKWMWLMGSVRMIKEILQCYVDILKDTYLLMTILVVIGGPSALILFPTKMTSVVVYCLFVSIVLPMFVSSVDLALDRIQDETCRV